MYFLTDTDGCVGISVLLLVLDIYYVSSTRVSEQDEEIVYLQIRRLASSRAMSVSL